MKLQGKSFDELRAALAGKSRDELIALLAGLVTVEPVFKPSEIAELSKRRRRDVLRDIRAGLMGDYFCFGTNSLAVPASGVNAWRASFRIPANLSNGRKAANG